MMWIHHLSAGLNRWIGLGRMFIFVKLIWKFLFSCSFWPLGKWLDIVEARLEEGLFLFLPFPGISYPRFGVTKQRRTISWPHAEITRRHQNFMRSCLVSSLLPLRQIFASFVTVRAFSPWPLCSRGFHSSKMLPLCGASVSRLESGIGSPCWGVAVKLS